MSEGSGIQKLDWSYSQDGISPKLSFEMCSSNRVEGHGQSGYCVGKREGAGKDIHDPWEA